MSKKTVIMEKALQLFAHEGYEHTGVQAIVDAADVTKPSLYHHFGNKDGLLETIYQSYFNALLQALDQTLPYTQDTIRSIEEVIQVYIRFAQKEPTFFWLANHLRKSPINSPARAIVKPFYQKERDFIHSLLVMICQNHSHLKGQEDFLTLSLLSLILGFIEVHLEADLDTLHEGHIHQLAKQFLYGIYAL